MCRLELPAEVFSPVSTTCLSNAGGVFLFSRSAWPALKSRAGGAFTFYPVKPISSSMY